MLSMVEFTRKWGRHRQKWLGEGRASQMTQGNGDALQHGKGLLKKQDSDREEVRACHITGRNLGTNQVCGCLQICSFRSKNPS